MNEGHASFGYSLQICPIMLCAYLLEFVVCSLSCMGKVTSAYHACLSRLVSIIMFMSCFWHPSTDNFTRYIGRWAGGGVESMCAGPALNGFSFKLPLNSC